MNLKNLLNESKSLQKEWINYRRFLHAHAETGFPLKDTTRFVTETLENMGYAPVPCGKSGIVATVGNPKKSKHCFLLRADMDALPITEETDLDFAACNGNMHACGHDMHTAMLLGAAQLLKSHENQLNGVVKLMFQPAEEVLEGASDMLAADVLKRPSVDAAMMIHVMTATPLPTGTVIVASGTSAPSADFFTIQVQGKGCHGSMPQEGVDALNVAAYILLALHSLSARETGISDKSLLTVGSFSAGKAANVIANSATLKGTMRAFDEKLRARLKKRVTEIAKTTAAAFRATATVTFDSGCPCLINDITLSNFAENAAKKLLNADMVYPSAVMDGGENSKSGGSEDFAYVTQKVPSVMLALSAGELKKGFTYPLHHPKAAFDEESLYVGSALYAAVAIQWLDKA